MGLEEKRKADAASQARARLQERIGKQNKAMKRAEMPIDNVENLSLEQLLSGDSDRKGATFPASDYEELCRSASDANSMERGTVSLVLPVTDMRLGSPEFRQGEADAGGSDFVTLACVDLSPHTAFLLASGLPLSKSSRDALADNGLSIRGLTMREAILTARRASDQLDK